MDLPAIWAALTDWVSHNLTLSAVGLAILGLLIPKVRDWTIARLWAYVEGAVRSWLTSVVREAQASDVASKAADARHDRLRQAVEDLGEALGGSSSSTSVQGKVGRALATLQLEGPKDPTFEGDLEAIARALQAGQTHPPMVQRSLLSRLIKQIRTEGM